MYCLPLRLLDRSQFYLCLITVEENIKNELMIIINLLKYQIINEYNLTSQKNILPSENIKLTKRQIEILKYLASGFTEEAIGINMGISVSTIKYHKQNIFKKLNAACSIEAIIKAIKYHIITLSDIDELYN